MDNDNKRYRRGDEQDQTYIYKGINQEKIYIMTAHLVLEIKITRDMKDKLEESYEKNSSYAKANYTAIKKFFNETKETKGCARKYNFFFKIYERENHGIRSIL